MNTSTRRLHTSGFACLAPRGGGCSEEVEGSGVTSALLRWEAGVGAGRRGALAPGWPVQRRAGTVTCPGGNALPATSCHFLQT